MDALPLPTASCSSSATIPSSPTRTRAAAAALRADGAADGDAARHDSLEGAGQSEKQTQETQETHRYIVTAVRREVLQPGRRVLKRARTLGQQEATTTLPSPKRYETPLSPKDHNRLGPGRPFDTSELRRRLESPRKVRKLSRTISAGGAGFWSAKQVLHDGIPSHEDVLKAVADNVDGLKAVFEADEEADQSIEESPAEEADAEAITKEQMVGPDPVTSPKPQDPAAVDASQAPYTDLLDGIDFEHAPWSSPEGKARPPLPRLGAQGKEDEADESAELELDEDEFGDMSFLGELQDEDLDADAFSGVENRSRTPEIRMVTSSSRSTTQHEPAHPSTLRCEVVHSSQPELDAPSASLSASMCPPLQTASGKAIAPPSAAALAKATSMLSRGADAQSSPPILSTSHEGKGKRKAADEETSFDADQTLPPPTAGFALASGKPFVGPSASALRAAEARLSEIGKDWEKEQTKKLASTSSESPRPEPRSDAPRPPHATAALQPAQPTASTPLRPRDTLSPVKFKAPGVMRAPSGPAPAAAEGTPSSSVQSSFRRPANPPPVRNAAIDNNAGGSVAEARSAPSVFQTPARPAAAVSRAPVTTPMRPPASAAASQAPSTGKSLGGRSSSFAGKVGSPSVGRRPKFKTPFKKEADRVAALRTQNATSPPRADAALAGPSRLHARMQPPQQQQRAKQPLPPVAAAQHTPVFDLETFRPRLRLSECGIQPEALSAEEASRAGVVSECLIILNEPAMARDFEFLQDTHGGARPPSVGPAEALAQLKKDGATLATLRWVFHHWTMILWKLAAICRHQPHECSTRWTFAEVVNQLKYRYQREVNLAQRSAIKRIQEHDSSPAQPMTLCVYQIQRNADPEQPPCVVLTDGWYTIRTAIDDVLFRAIIRERLKVGHKLHISGARLECSGDGTEVLDAFDSSVLQINANGCSLARWDARLGFTKTPFISTLRALSGEGGAVPMMRIKILRVFDMGYIDTSPPNASSSSGSQRSGSGSAPRANVGMATARSEAEEAQAAAAWESEREEWRHKLQEDWNSKLRRTHLVCQLLHAAQRVASAKRPNADDDAAAADLSSSFDADTYLDRLETASDPSAVLKSIPAVASRLPLLISAAQQRQNSLQTEAHAELEAELDEKVPPRHVRSFRVVRFADYYPELDDASPPLGPRQYTNAARAMGIKLCGRQAQLTVWDAARLEGHSHGEGGVGGSEGIALKEGHTFLVTELVPASVGSWRPVKDENAEVFLATRRNTRWIPIA